MTIHQSVIENIATLFATALIVVGLAAFGAGGWSLFGLVLLFNLNSPPRSSS